MGFLSLPRLVEITDFGFDREPSDRYENNVSVHWLWYRRVSFDSLNSYYSAIKNLGHHLHQRNEILHSRKKYWFGWIFFNSERISMLEWRSNLRCIIARLGTRKYRPKIIFGLFFFLGSLLYFFLNFPLLKRVARTATAQCKTAKPWTDSIFQIRRLPWKQWKVFETDVISKINRSLLT